MIFNPIWFFYFLLMGIETKNTSIATINHPKALEAASPSKTIKANTAATIVRARYPIDHKDKIISFPNLP